jgi:hypothetical protein
MRDFHHNLHAADVVPMSATLREYFIFVYFILISFMKPATFVHSKASSARALQKTMMSFWKAFFDRPKEGDY